MTEFNYVLYIDKEGDYNIVKTIEPPTFKYVDLDPTQAYDVVKIKNKSDYPGLFLKDEKPKYFAPIRKVMCRIDTCDFCEQIKSVDEIKQEYTDLDNRLGYFYCNECKDILIDCLKNSGVSPIWYIRERNEKKLFENTVWIERSRRDENGNIVNFGPYIFEKWKINGWYAYLLNDKSENIMKPHITCEGNGYIKSVSIAKILELNPEDNPDYNPNEDPKYK
jgi:hypothetical protein